MRTPNLTHLATLAQLAKDDPDATRELRAHMLAHAEAYAALLGVSTATWCASVEATPDSAPPPVNGLAYVVAATIAHRRKSEAEHRRAEREDAASVAAARVGETAVWADGVATLDADAVRASLACGEARVCFAIGGNDADAPDVDARLMREILALRDDARVIVALESGKPRVSVTWGKRGRIRFVPAAPHSYAARVLYLPAPPALAPTVAPPAFVPVAYEPAALMREALAGPGIAATRTPPLDAPPPPVASAAIAPAPRPPRPRRPRAAAAAAVAIAPAPELAPVAAATELAIAPAAAARCAPCSSTDATLCACAGWELAPVAPPAWRPFVSRKRGGDELAPGALGELGPRMPFESMKVREMAIAPRAPRARRRRRTRTRRIAPEAARVAA